MKCAVEFSRGMDLWAVVLSDRALSLGCDRAWNLGGVAQLVFNPYRQIMPGVPSLDRRE
jgi:hypothetical protein